MAPAECTQTNAVVGRAVSIETETRAGNRGAVTYSVVGESGAPATPSPWDSVSAWQVSTGTDPAELFPDVTAGTVTRAQNGEATVSKKTSEQRRLIEKLPVVGRLARAVEVTVAEEDDGIYAVCSELQATESGSDCEDAILNLVESMVEQFEFWRSVTDAKLTSSAKALRDKYVSLKR